MIYNTFNKINLLRDEGIEHFRRKINKIEKLKMTNNTN